MHAKGRQRGKNLRYIKNPKSSFFRRPEPLSEVRAISGSRTIKKNKVDRKPNFPERDIPKFNKSHKSD